MISPAHELQEEIGEANIPVIISILFFATVVSMFFVVISFASSSNLRPEIKDSETGGREGPSDTTVQVSAEVRDTLGTKYISENITDKTMLIFGNHEGGFSVIDCRYFGVIYHQTVMPGDGVMIKVPKSVQNTCIMSYY